MEPEAYRIGWVPFLGLEICLDSQPLIPRVETELWTEQLLTRAQGGLFLDLCAGSGAIGCAALRYLPWAVVWFGEIDPTHEATILKNVRKNGLDESRAQITIGDLFAPFPVDMRFDVIAANPPYVPETRKLPREVVDYEPALALRAGADGLAVIRRIAQELPARLMPSGTAWIECDSLHAEEARSLFEASGLRAELMLDQYSRPRVVVISLP